MNQSDQTESQKSNTQEDSGSDAGERQPIWEGKHEVHRYAKIGLTVFVTFVACILFFFILWRFQGLSASWKQIMNTAQPIIIGLVLAYLLNPVMKYCERNILKWLKPRMKNSKSAKKTARGMAVTFAILFLMLIIGLLIAAIVPAVVSSVVSLMDTLPSSVESFTLWLNEITNGDNPIANWIGTYITQATDFIENWATNTLLPQAQRYITEITSGVISILRTALNFIIGIIVAVYVMMIKETLTGQSKKIIYALFKPSYGNIIIETVRKSHEIFGGFVSGKLLDSAIIGVICYIGCLILGIPDAILVAVIIGCTNIIPFFGPIIGAVPCILLVVIQSPIHALYLLIFVLVLQQVDGNIIGPKILGNSTGLSSFWVMFAILIAGGMWGFPGMVLGVPTFAVFYYVIRRVVSYALRRKNLPYSTREYIHMVNVDEKTNTLNYEEEHAKPPVKDADASDVEFGYAPGEEKKKKQTKK